MGLRIRTVARRLGLTTPLLVAGLVTGGCSGGSSTVRQAASGPASGSSTTGSSPPAGGTSLDSFIGRADAICKQLNDELPKERSAHPSNNEIARNAPRNAALELRALTELAKLTPPSSLTGDWGKIMLYRRTLAAELTKLAAFAQANDTAGVQALVASKQRTHEKLLNLAVRDGFRECSRIVSPQARHAPASPSTGLGGLHL